MRISDITPANAVNFAEGNYRYYSGDYPAHYLEQFIYRTYLCKDCLEYGKCKICKCTMPQKAFAPRKTDAMNKWPPFKFNAEDWEQYKKDHLNSMVFTTLFNKDNIPNPISPDTLLALIADAEDLIAKHREQDALNPEIPIEKTEFFKRNEAGLTGVRTEYSETTIGDTSEGNIFS